MEYNLGQRVGLTGTPMILASDGTQLGGYIPPEQLRAALDKLAAGRPKPAPATATGSLLTGAGDGQRRAEPALGRHAR